MSTEDMHTLGDCG